MYVAQCSSCPLRVTNRIKVNHALNLAYLIGKKVGKYFTLQKVVIYVNATVVAKELTVTIGSS